MSAAALFANLGAEEGESWRRMAAHPRVRAAARLWAALFPAGARAVGPVASLGEGLLAPFSHDAARAAFGFCEGGGLVPWLSTAEARDRARGEGLALAAAPPEVVARVHDKAFALRAAREAGLEPGDFAGAALALAADELGTVDAVRCRVEEAVTRWPEPLRARFVLKPRLGTSGRGRLEGRAGALDPEALRGALPRFRERGGVVVEPWLERVADLSAQLFVPPAGEPVLLGTTQQVLTPGGVPLGHCGELGAGGEVRSGHRWDGELRAAALALGGAAAAAGFTGPCGVDAFSYRDAAGREQFRPVVELNARFTAGISALGVLARARRLGRLAGRRVFHVGVAPRLADPAAERISLLAGEPELALWLA